MIRAFLLSLLISISISQTTGKISGIVTDKKNSVSLPGANVYLENTSYGTASNVEGRFTLINIPPGKYILKADMIGYKSIRMEAVNVSVNRTLSLKIEMDETVLEGEVVTVEVARLAQKKDQTGTIKNISGEEIEALPVENVGAVVNMQAGVVNGHFRGGRNTEVTYMIDGVQVDETFGGTSATVDIQPEAVQDLEVITGTFNAEYGRAMSGVVNVVTKDGGPNFEGFASFGTSSFYTGNDSIFIGLSPSLNNSRDFKLNFSGPILGDRITFFTNIRKQFNNGHLNGYRIFSVDDYSNFYADDSTMWYSEKSGDRNYVPMNTGENLSVLLKLSFKIINGIRFSLLHSYSNDNWFGYDHGFKYNPDGRAGSYKKTHYTAFQLNHMISQNLFYEMKFSYVDNYFGNYVFKDSTDIGYVHDRYYESYGSGFLTGGQSKDHTTRKMIDQTVKLDATWQANHSHSFKTGIHYFGHNLNNRWHAIRNKYYNTASDSIYEPVVFGDTSAYADVYEVSPQEYAFYLQDKMEFDNMVINLGARYDLFDPKSEYPSDRRNPGNQLFFIGDGIWNEGEDWIDSNGNGVWDWTDSNGDSLVDEGESEEWTDISDKMSTYPDAPVIEQVSPRIGFAYQLGNQAVLHFSYGHFFQMPPMYAMYQNHSFLVDPSDFVTRMGNTLLQPEKTVTYEIGLWQELNRNISLDVALFYRDIYNLLTTKTLSTYNQVKYGLYSNKDYGNARGLEVQLDLGLGTIKGIVNYTLQYTRGNADSPGQTFDRAGNNQDPVNRFIPMSWDQRHTLNASLMYLQENYGGTLTAYYNSGSPYTFSPQNESVLSRINLYPNNDYRPEKYRVDGAFYYKFNIPGGSKANLDINIYNIFDRLNEEWVNGQTGRAYTAIIRDTDLAAHRSDFNDYRDRIENPSMYSSPRSIKVSLGIDFYSSSGPSESDINFESTGPSVPINERDIKSEDLVRPEPTGSPEIDKFVNAAFDLHDKIVELKDKLKNVSDGLAVSSDIIVAIDMHPDGALGWATAEVSNGASKVAQSVNQDTLSEKLTPSHYLREELASLKSGIVDGVAELESIPVDLKAIGEQAQTLLLSTKNLPKAAKSLGFRKAPAALKSIKVTAGVLKNIPKELKIVGDETKELMEEIDQILKNLQNLLSNT